MRKLGANHNDAGFYMKLIANRPAETIANITVILINQADYLLFRQIEKVSGDFIKNGGFSKRMNRLIKQQRVY